MILRVVAHNIKRVSQDCYAYRSIATKETEKAKGLPGNSRVSPFCYRYMRTIGVIGSIPVFQTGGAGSSPVSCSHRTQAGA